MEWVVENWDTILVVFFAVMGIASTIAKITPNKTDNKIIDIILRTVQILGLNQDRKVEELKNGE